MKIKIINTAIKKEKVINVSYVWDREDKYLVLSDDEEKLKYTANTMKGDFDSDDVTTLLESYVINVLGWTIATDLGGGRGRINVVYQYISGRTPNRCCHNDDFYEHYKKTYKLVAWSETGLQY